MNDGSTVEPSSLSATTGSLSGAIIPPWARSMVMKSIGEECTSELLDRLNFYNVPCLRMALSKGLSLGIIGGAMVVKLPQIAKVLLSRSAEGLSFLAYVLETLAASIAFAYNWRAGNPFSTYGETLFMTVQNVLLLLLMGLYRGQTMQLVLLFSCYSVMMSSLLIPSYLSDATLRSLQAMTIPLVMISRLPQIWTIWRHGHTGQISALTTSLIWAGSMARVYTCLQETPDDRVLLLGFLLAALLNSILVGQVLYYWNAAPVQRRKASMAPSTGRRKESLATTSSPVRTLKASGIPKKVRARQV